MQIKSWQIALAGIIPIIILFLIMLGDLIGHGPEGPVLLIFIIPAILLGILSIPIKFMASANGGVRKNGAILGIFIGIIGILAMRFLSFFSLFTGVILIIASIYELKDKRK